MAVAEQLAGQWRSRLKQDCPSSSEETQESIVQWLLGDNPERFEEMNTDQLEIAQQAMDYRWRIFQQRYFNVSPEKAYGRLMQRLGSLFLIRNKVRTWVALSRDRQRSVTEVLQELIQDLLQNDRYLQQQIRLIACCTPHKRLQNALILATAEEYCLRPIRNQPLLLYRFVNYLRRTSRGGMTQVPANDLVRLVSEELVPDDTDNPVSLLDREAIAQYQENQAWEERQRQRMKVYREFAAYLEEKLDRQARDWLELYLKGYSQEAIAQSLQMPIKQVYRLREKVSYHAVRIFALKQQPELVANWLEISLKEHNFGLTLSQWEGFWATLTPDQQNLLELMKEGKSVEAIAKALNWKANQVVGEWSKLYLAAQAIRSAS